MVLLGLFSDDDLFSSADFLLPFLFALVIAWAADLRSFWRDRRRRYAITSRRIMVDRADKTQSVDDWEIARLTVALHGEGERGTIRVALDDGADLDRPWWKRAISYTDIAEEEKRIVELSHVEQPLAAKAAIERLVANARHRLMRA